MLTVNSQRQSLLPAPMLMHVALSIEKFGVTGNILLGRFSNKLNSKELLTFSRCTTDGGLVTVQFVCSALTRSQPLKVIKD